MSSFAPIAAKKPYRVFDYDHVDVVDGTGERKTCYMVSTLTLPQHPVALCGPDKAFADALCALMNWAK